MLHFMRHPVLLTSCCQPMPCNVMPHHLCGQAEQSPDHPFHGVIAADQWSVVCHVNVPASSPGATAAVRGAQVGVGIHGDGLKVQRDWGLPLGGQVDLSDMALDRGITRGGAFSKWSLAGASCYPDRLSWFLFRV